MPLGWVDHIERLTLGNDTFRTVVFTGEHHQLTVMRLAPGEEIGLELHAENDQFIRIEQGEGRLELGATEDSIDEAYEVFDDWAFVVPAGVWHNLVNTGSDDLKLYSLYAPPHHAERTIHHTKAEAEAAEREEHG